MSESNLRPASEGIKDFLAGFERRSKLPHGGNQWQQYLNEYMAQQGVVRQGRGAGYLFDWAKHFSPIERICWNAMRDYGLLLCPQYPVGGFFVDFADPVLKIAIEADGKAYHSEAKDKPRDVALSDLGWIVFRLPGSDCVRYLEGGDTPDIDDYGRVDIDQRNYDWLSTTSDGFFYALSVMIYGQQRDMAEYCANPVRGRLPIWATDWQKGRLEEMMIKKAFEQEQAA